MFKPSESMSLASDIATRKMTASSVRFSMLSGVKRGQKWRWMTAQRVIAALASTKP